MVNIVFRYWIDLTNDIHIRITVIPVEENVSALREITLQTGTHSEERKRRDQKVQNTQKFCRKTKYV